MDIKDIYGVTPLQKAKNDHKPKVQEACSISMSEVTRQYNSWIHDHSASTEIIASLAGDSRDDEI